jgi:hypothetical protein
MTPGCEYALFLERSAPTLNSRQFSDSSAADWFQLSAVLLLATKYEIARIRRQALRFLAHSWPYTLAGHDDMIERALRRDAVNGLSYPFVHPLHVLGLARAADVRSLLFDCRTCIELTGFQAPLLIPAAMYFLSMYPVGDLVRADHPKLRTPHPHARPATLGANELADYARMFQHRLELMLEFTRRELPAAAPVAGCTHPQGAGGSGPCSHTLRQLASRLARSWVQRTSPLHFMAQAPLGLAGHPICTPCREAFCARIAAVRERTWQALPAVIGMPGWDVLLGDLEEDS